MNKPRIGSIQINKTPIDKPIRIGNLTLFVGPNNSGKSTLINEIFSELKAENKDSKILKDLKLDFKSDLGSILDLIKPLSSGKTDEGWHSLEYLECHRNGNWQVSSHRFYENQLASFSADNIHILYNTLTRPFTILLSGQTRFLLSQTQLMEDMSLKKTINHFDSLAKSTELYGKARGIIFRCIGKFFYIFSFTNGKHIPYLLDVEIPKELQQSISPEATAYFKEEFRLEHYGDGYKALVGIITAVVSGQYNHILIDEPEAYLHPTLAHKLGYELAKFANENDIQLIISTHNSHFLSGCLSANGQDSTVVRLTREGDSGNWTQLNNEEVIECFKKPKMRVSNVIDALFSEHVILVESPGDQIVYSEVNQKLLEIDKSRGIQNALFIPVHGKASFQSITKRLKQLGVKVAIIGDLDTIYQINSILPHLVSNKPILDSIIHQKSTLLQELPEQKKQEDKNKYLKDNGISAFEREGINDFLEKLQKRGIFLVPVGELENWDNQISNEGEGFAIQYLEKLEDQPLEENNALYKFIENVASFFNQKPY